MQHRDYIVIRKVIDEINIGLEMLGDTELPAFMDDEKLKRAVAMTVINIGELIKNVTMETRSKYPKIPWRAAAGMRDLAAHKYQTLRMEDVYRTARVDFPALKNQLEAIMEEDE
ncbi:MAG: DUF86 domain-containing protein [Lachnospiraceae bacterium]|nr:DUF86 domain-containing protein [Lachnospiraceae bacterium]